MVLSIWLLCIAITVAIARWVFRINQIVSGLVSILTRMDKIITLIEAKGKP